MDGILLPGEMFKDFIGFLRDESLCNDTIDSAALLLMTGPIFAGSCLVIIMTAIVIP
jgi:hypothetical protein